MRQNKLITEGLDFHDMEGQLIPTVTVDEYSAKMGEDRDIVTLAFVVKSEAAGNDLADWFEGGYDYVLDAQVSEGELEANRWLVFVEMNRRSTVPSRIVELLTDLKTLTNIKVKDWAIKVNEEDHEPDEQILKQVIICNPNVYKVEKEEEDKLNEMREIAGLGAKKIYQDDNDTKALKTLAGM